jgi:hypothetical protein
MSGIADFAFLIADLKKKNRYLNDLDNLQINNLPRVKINPLLELPRQMFLAQGDNPALFDDQFFNDASANESHFADGGIFALWHAAGEEELSPFLRQWLGKTVAWGILRVHH